MIVVGAGEVGSYVAERLSQEGHDVAVIERDPARLRSVDEEIDVLAVLGSGTHPEALVRAGVDHTDILLAVTSDDSANIVSSMLAKSMGVERTIVRIEAAELRGREADQIRRQSGGDLFIDPDAETANEILELLDYPGADEVTLMAEGEVVVIGARLPAHSPLVNRTLADIAEEYEPDWDFMVSSIGRGDETIIPRSDHQLLVDDHLRVVLKRRARRLVVDLLGISRGATRKVMLLGGGHTAELLATRLATRGVGVVIIERDHDRARELAETLDDAMILEGDVTDSTLLEQADVGRFDAVVAMTAEDDANILACLYAKSGGARETIAVVHRLALLNLLKEVGIDVALSPRTATANGVLRFVRGGVAKVATFLHGNTEVIELEVAVDSPADGTLVRDLGLPRNVIIAAIVRDGKAQIGRGRSRMRGRDHVVVVAVPEAVDEVRRLLG